MNFYKNLESSVFDFTLFSPLSWRTHLYDTSGVEVQSYSHNTSFFEYEGPQTLWCKGGGLLLSGSEDISSCEPSLVSFTTVLSYRSLPVNLVVLPSSERLGGWTHLLFFWYPRRRSPIRWTWEPFRSVGSGRRFVEESIWGGVGAHLL